MQQQQTSALPTTNDIQQSQPMTPLDDVITQVGSYIKDFSLVTPQTLKDLRKQLIVIQADVEGDDTGTPEQNQPDNNSFSGSISNNQVGS